MLVEITCYNSNCPGYEANEDGTATGHTYLGTEVPPTHNDPGYIEGECPLCGEFQELYDNIETFSPEELEALKYNV